MSTTTGPSDVGSTGRLRTAALLVWWVSALVPFLLSPMLFTDVTAMLALFALSSLLSFGGFVAGVVLSALGRMWTSPARAVATLVLIASPLAITVLAMFAMSEPYDPTGPCAGDGPDGAAICPTGPTMAPSTAQAIVVGLLAAMGLATFWWIRQVRSRPPHLSPPHVANSAAGARSS